MLHFFIFIAPLLLMVKAADMAIRSSSKLAKSLHLSTHVVGFLIIAGISVLPETLVSVQAALQGVPSFGVATLFGSNVADLSLVFVLVLLFSKKGLKVESKILKDQYWYFLALLVPILLGYDGTFTRLEGLALVLTGVFFHMRALKRDHKDVSRLRTQFSWASAGLLLLSMALLLLGSYATVESGVALAETLGVSPVLVGMLLVGLGTTLPETFFAIKAVRHNDAPLALGDILGTVMTDATIVLGIVALIAPFTFDVRLVHLTGMYMLFGAILLFYFMQSGHTLKRKEGLFLFVFYLIFVFTELITAQN